MFDAIVIGAGIAGLACARDLVAGGRSVQVLEFSRGVGGRCTTRRFDEQPVDTGPLFLHGRDPGFLSAARTVPGATLLEGWPGKIEGTGAPCQPDAFDPLETRFAYAEGLSVFGRHLARGLNVQLETKVTGLTINEKAISVLTESGVTLYARDVVLALALEQTLRLVPGSPDFDSVRALLNMFTSVPSLTLVAGYSLDTPAPEWDVQYPEASDCFQLISHDSNKREHPRMRVLVFQARPRWSREQMEAGAEVWGPKMLEEAGKHLGPWAARPQFSYPHRWRFARLERGTELSQPICVALPGGPRLGFAGDLFSPGGGVEAAWLSGRRLAQRLLQET